MRTSLIPFLTTVGTEISEKNLTLTAAGVAFFAMFSLFPSLAALIALWGLWLDPDAVLTHLAPLESFLPQDVYAILASQTTALASTHSETLTFGMAMSLMLALWAARAGVAAIMRAMNIIHGVPNRSLVRHYSTALGMTLALIILTMVGLLASVGLPLLLRFFPFDNQTQTLLLGLRLVLGITTLYLGVRLLHTHAPNTTKVREWFLPGALFSTFGILLASYGLSVYIEHFDSYNKTYGSLGAVIATLMWLYLSTLLVLIGGVITAQLAKNACNQP